MQILHGSSVLDASIGTTYSTLIDKTLSRVSKKYTNIALNVDYKYSTDNYMYRYELGSNFGNYNSVGNGFNDGTAVETRASFAMYMPFESSLSSLDYAIGMKLAYSMNVMMPQNALRYGWDATLGLHPAWMINYEINDKWKLSLDGDIYLYGRQWRPHAQGFDLTTEELLEDDGIVSAFLENGEMTSIVDTLKIQQSAQLYYFYKENIYIYGKYTLNYNHISLPRDKYQNKNTFLLGVSYHF